MGKVKERKWKWLKKARKSEKATSLSDLIGFLQKHHHQ